MGTTAYGGKRSKGRAANGDRPVGAASCRRDHHTMASCQNPPACPCFSSATAKGTVHLPFAVVMSKRNIRTLFKAVPARRVLVILTSNATPNPVWAAWRTAVFECRCRLLAPLIMPPPPPRDHLGHQSVRRLSVTAQRFGRGTEVR